MRMGGQGLEDEDEEEDGRARWMLVSKKGHTLTAIALHPIAIHHITNKFHHITITHHITSQSIALQLHHITHHIKKCCRDHAA